MRVSSIKEQTGKISMMYLILKACACSQFLQMQNMEEAMKMSQETMKESIEYFEGNEVNESMCEPLLIMASCYFQLGNIQMAVQTAVKCEKILKELSGEVNEKLMDVYSLLGTLMLH